MERCCGQAAMVHADHVNSWWGVELLIPLLKHTTEFYFCVKIPCVTDANTWEVPCCTDYAQSRVVQQSHLPVKLKPLEASGRGRSWCRCFFCACVLWLWVVGR